MFDIAGGFLLDLAAGDPYWFPHPVRIIGRVIKSLEKLLRKVSGGSRGEKIAGIVLAAVVVILTYASTWWILHMARFNTLVYHGTGIVLIYFTLSVKSLGKEAKRVYNCLQKEDIASARYALSGIVGRDTENLDSSDIIRAAVETVAENTSDGIIAPLFFAFLGGPSLAMAYKAVNTLDSMVGYRDERYINLGWASARLDDIVNYIPARLTALLFVAASFVTGGQYRRSLATVVEDGRKHSSPNSGFPEAAVAGSLGIQLGGANYYFGKRVDKPVIGSMDRKYRNDDIISAVVLMYVASITGLLVFGCIWWMKLLF